VLRLEALLTDEQGRVAGRASAAASASTKANTGVLRLRAARFAQYDGVERIRERQVQQQVPPLRS